MSLGYACDCTDVPCSCEEGVLRVRAEPFTYEKLVAGYARSLELSGFAPHLVHPEVFHDYCKSLVPRGVWSGG